MRELYVDLAADLRASVCCDLSTVLRVEVRDLRVVLQSSDKELEATRTELQQQKAEHERETTVPPCGKKYCKSPVIPTLTSTEFIDCHKSLSFIAFR